MKLQPLRPPGHANRKALAYASEIQRLRAQGYSHAAIRDALLQVGLQVSLTTVKRETARAPQASSPPAAICDPGTDRPPTTPAAQRLPVPSAGAAASQAASTSALTPVGAPIAPPVPYTRESLRRDPRSSRDIADAFMKDYVANPLLNRSPR